MTRVDTPVCPWLIVQASAVVPPALLEAARAGAVHVRALAEQVLRLHR